MITLNEIAERLDRIENLLLRDAETQVQAVGLLSYEDLQDRLTIGRKSPRRPCLRTVKALVRKHRKIARPVELGHTLVGFREASVRKLIAHLAGEETFGGRRL